MLLPYVKRLVDFTHSQGLIFELHSCGKNEILTPVMIEAGVDVWKPQPMNDIKYLCKEYGDKIRIGISPDGLDPYNMPTEPAQFIAIAEAYVENAEDMSASAARAISAGILRNRIYTHPRGILQSVALKARFRTKDRNFQNA